ncbi:MAG: Isoaspartyl dipeptidase [Acetothermia bacterium 64_32]|nr:MAG: Isoaspartyl dipeptidase [Acetothermia bacterium 64_32]HAF71382.1 beta-aspartyl-peptidase [Candidatus Acetothermia bacterium]
MRPPLTLIKGARLYASSREVDVLFSNVILALGERIPEPKGIAVELYDAEGRLLVPGLIDLHTHPIGGGGEAGPTSRVPELSLAEIVAGGITTLVGCLGTDDVTRHLEALLAKVRALSTQGITAYMYTGSYQVPPPTLTGSVRRDLVLIPEVLGVGEIAISDHRSSQPTFEELARIAAEARVGGMLAGKKGVVHLHVGAGRKGLSPLFRLVEETEIPILQFHPTHVGRTADLLDEAIEWAKEGGTFDLTAPSATLSWDRPFPEIVRRLERAGVPWDRVTLSSDGGGSMPKFDGTGNLVGFATGRPASLWQAVRTLVKEGYPLEHVLPLVTENPARVLGIADRKGSIEEGKDADLLVLGEDLSIERVYAKGRALAGPAQDVGPLGERLWP